MGGYFPFLIACGNNFTIDVQGGDNPTIPRPEVE